MIRAAAWVLALSVAAQAEPIPLKSFSYVSTGCYSKGDLLTWGGTDNYRLTERIVHFTN